MTPQELFGGVVGTVLDCKDIVIADDLIDSKSDIPKRTVSIVNNLLLWKKKCEDEKKFTFPDMSSEDRKYTSCDWLINGVKCFAHAAYRGELNLLKWIRYDIKDENFFKIEDEDTAELFTIAGISHHALPVIKWLKECDGDIFSDVTHALSNQSMIYEMMLFFHPENDLPKKDTLRSIRYFMAIGNMDQLQKYFSRFEYNVRDIENFECENSSVYSKEVLRFIMEKVEDFHITIPFICSDLSKACEVVEMAKEIKGSTKSFRESPIIIPENYEKKYLLKFFDLIGPKKFFRLFKVIHTTSSVIQYLIANRLDSLKQFVGKRSLCELFNCGFIGPSDEIIVMIYEAVNQ